MNKTLRVSLSVLVSVLAFGASAPLAFATANPVLTVQATATITRSALVPETSTSSGAPTGGNPVVDAAIVGLTAIPVTLANAGDTTSANVRISPIGADSHIQLWARDTSGNWTDINVTGWGPTAGFPVPVGSVTTNVYAISDTTGDYHLTVNLVNAVDGTPNTSTTGTVTVTPIAHTLADFAAFDGVGSTTLPTNHANGYTLSSGITTTYPGSNTIKLTGYAPIVIPWFDLTRTTFNYVTIGIKLPAGFSGNPTVFSTGVSSDDGSTYDMGSGSTPLATTGAASGYLDFSFGANKSYVKNGLVKLEVIWNAGDAPEYFTIDVSGLQLGPVFNVSNLNDLKAALANTDVTTINITADIPAIPATLVVPVGHPVTINGGGHTLAFTGLESVVGNVDDGFMIQAPTIINNLIVDAGLATPATWVGTYAIQVYGTTATLNNVTATNANGGILINGSTATLTGVTTVSGNGFGGIEVSKDTPPNASALTVTGTLVNSTEAYGLPTIWLVNDQGTVTGANVPSTTSTTIVAGQTQYYLTAGNATAPIFGCMDPTATNYNSSATNQTGVTCTYQSSGGQRAIPAVPANVTTPVGCAPGDKFSSTTGRNCNAATPATPSTNSNGNANGNANGRVLGAATFNFSNNLGVGSRGADVTALQQFLIDGGYAIPAGATGYFGSQTKAAVTAYQKARGIANTGFVGPLTRGELNRGAAAAGSGVTVDQMNSILTVLQSFSVDQTIIDKVRVALTK